MFVGFTHDFIISDQNALQQKLTAYAEMVTGKFQWKALETLFMALMYVRECAKGMTLANIQFKPVSFF